jgi:hypothetical protein
MPKPKVNEDLEYVRRHFGVYYPNPKFDKSILTLLNLPLPAAAVIEIASGIWSEAYDHGEADAYNE